MFSVFACGPSRAHLYNIDMHLFRITLILSACFISLCLSCSFAEIEAKEEVKQSGVNARIIKRKNNIIVVKLSRQQMQLQVEYIKLVRWGYS